VAQNFLRGTLIYPIPNAKALHCLPKRMKMHDAAQAILSLNTGPLQVADQDTWSECSFLVLLLCGGTLILVPCNGPTIVPLARRHPRHGHEQMLAPADRFPGAARVSSGQGAAVPAVTFPGVFALRQKAGLTKCSGLLVLDFVTPKLIRHPFRRDATVLMPD
jgi:hypothetical protein